MSFEELSLEEWKRMQAEWGGGLREGSREWRAAWQRLLRLTRDRDHEAECPLTGEVWQYLSSFRDRGRWMHEFRHRHHPVKQRRWYVQLPASPGWTPEDDRPEPKHTVH